MNSSITLSSLAVALSLALGQSLSAFPNAADFYVPGNNAFFTSVPDPLNPGFTMDGIAIVKTDAEMAEAVTLYDGFPPGVLDPSSGITIALSARFFGLVGEMNALNLTVGSMDPLTNYSPGIFSHVFGIHSIAPGGTASFGFGGANFMHSFGVLGSEVSFIADGQDSNANRFLSSEGLADGYRAAFVSTPFPFVPDTGSTAALLALAWAGVVCIRRFRK
jgi:hypothetical protein